jgi:uncharacterized protein (TIGR02271 family)
VSSKTPTRLETKDRKKGVVQVERAEDGLALLKMDNGQRVWAPIELLQERNDGSYYLPLDMDTILSQSETAEGSDRETIRIVPIVQEELVIDKQKRETGKVRVHKHVQTRQETVDEPGYIEELFFERVPVNKVIDAPQTSRYEGKTLVIPLIEEELVVQKRLVLREELRVTKKRKEVRNKQNVTLRKEEVTIDRINPENKTGKRTKNE